MDIYELIGFAIGDGHIFYSKAHRKYKLELAGNAVEDKDYFESINRFLISKTGTKPQLFVRNHKRGKSLCLNLYNKKFVDMLIDYGLPAGKKTFTIEIPNKLSKKNEKSILRGLFEADGCLYFSRSKKCEFPTYPRLEIKTSSPKLLKQLKNILQDRSFKIYIKNPSGDKTFAIGLSGENSLEKWRKEIGFGGLKNKSKYQLWKINGFYIPKTSLPARLRKLEAHARNRTGTNRAAADCNSHYATCA